ncbi:Uncharacterised protein [Mycobacterium tuberculosis]|nr:Uncharacterised protein [Mycobacterium tuberculosis]
MLYRGRCLRVRRLGDPGAARITRIRRCACPRRAGPPLDQDLLYEVDGDVATGRSASVVTLATAAGYKILGSGEYQDRLIKQDGQWRIAYRRLRNDRLVSDPSVAVNVADADVAAVVGHLLAAARRLGTQMSDT